MINNIHILIADDHPLLRRGLREEIESAPNLKVVAEASDGQEALDKIEQFRPRIAVLDIDMPRLDGFKVAKAVRAQQLPVEIVFLTVHREETYLSRSLQTGVLGYVLKDSASTDIVACIMAVAAGQPYASPAMTAYLLKRSRRLTDQMQGLGTLTPTERTILKMIADYKTTRDIAEALFISPRTVETHRANICQKLDLRGSHTLMKFALAHQAELNS